MPAHTPSWLVWLSPLCAILGAWFIGVQSFQSGFGTILIVSLICALQPFIAFRIGRRLRNKLQNG